MATAPKATHQDDKLELQISIEHVVVIKGELSYLGLLLVAFLDLLDLCCHKLHDLAYHRSKCVDNISTAHLVSERLPKLVTNHKTYLVMSISGKLNWSWSLLREVIGICMVHLRPSLQNCGLMPFSHSLLMRRAIPSSQSLFQVPKAILCLRRFLKRSSTKVAPHSLPVIVISCIVPSGRKAGCHTVSSDAFLNLHRVLADDGIGDDVLAFV